MEKCLCDNLNKRTKYHGGQYEDATAILLFQKADVIFESIKQLYFEVSKRLCDDHEVIDMIERYVELFK